MKKHEQRQLLEIGSCARRRAPGKGYNAGNFFPVGDEAGPPTRSLRILVVDDNADAASMLAMYLAAAGHEVAVEHDAWHVLERARILAPDVCILDIGLPETAGAVLIAVTGYGREEDRKAAMLAGFRHHLVKPVNAALLAAVLHGIG